MRVLRLAAMIVAIVGGYLALPGPASAAPLGAGALPFAQTEAPLVTKAQWGHRRGYGHRGYGHRRPVGLVGAAMATAGGAVTAIAAIGAAMAIVVPCTAGVGRASCAAGVRARGDRARCAGGGGKAKPLIDNDRRAPSGARSHFQATSRLSPRCSASASGVKAPAALMQHEARQKP